MKLIKAGRNQKGWSKKVTCTGGGNGNGGCGSILLAEQDDLFITSRSSLGETDTFTTFCCMQCGVLTDFKDGEVPRSVSDYLPTHKIWQEIHPRVSNRE